MSQFFQDTAHLTLWAGVATCQTSLVPCTWCASGPGPFEPACRLPGRCFGVMPQALPPAAGLYTTHTCQIEVTVTLLALIGFMSCVEMLAAAWCLPF